MEIQNPLKSYVDNTKKDMKFQVYDKAFLKVLPMKRVLHFGKKTNLRYHFIELFEILERIENLTYHLALPPKFSAEHNVFLMIIINKYLQNPGHVVNYQMLEA